MSHSEDGSASSKKILLIGAGKMGGALFKGWIAAGFAPARFIIIDPHISDEIVKIGAGARINPEAGEIKALAPDLVVLAVKPQAAASILAKLRGFLPRARLILSILAGGDFAFLRQNLDPSKPDITSPKETHRYIRAMPNIPVLVGRGSIALLGEGSETLEDRLLVEGLMQAVGMPIWLETEAMLDMATALSGAGPAYIFYMVEVMAEVGKTLGLPANFAQSLARASVVGAGEMLHRQAQTPAQLRMDVTSPGGVTEAALDILMRKEGLLELMHTAIAAGTARAKKLAS